MRSQRSSRGRIVVIATRSSLPRLPHSPPLLPPRLHGPSCPLPWPRCPPSTVYPTPAPSLTRIHFVQILDSGCQFPLPHLPPCSDRFNESECYSFPPWPAPLLTWTFFAASALSSAVGTTKNTLYSV